MSVGTLVASCHCGRALITLPRTPEYVAHCNCSLCTKTGFQGVYFSSDELKIEGEFDSYVRADSNPACLATHRCRYCGIVTHWEPLTAAPHERMGVNANLFDRVVLDEAEVNEVDGASWPL